MMESESKCPKEFLHKIKELIYDKETLEKCTSALMECVTIDKLKEKINDVTVSLETLEYLKIILEKKLSAENQMNQIQLKSPDELKPCFATIDTKCLDIDLFKKLYYETIDAAVYHSVETDWYQKVNNFDEMNLKEQLLRGIYEYGFQKPSAIQQLAIPACTKGRDVIVQAQPGTGKTATFSISILQQIDTDLNKCQALILVPKRELAQQIQEMIIALGNFMKADCYFCFDETKLRDEMQILETRPHHILIGTPRRVYDLISRKSLDTQFIKIVVLNKAVRLSAFQFQMQTKKVLKSLKEDIQVIVFFDTMPKGGIDVIHQFVRNPVHIFMLGDQRQALEGIKQFFVVTKEEQKFDTLCNLCSMISITQALIFCNKRERVGWLTEKLRSKAYCACAIYGKMNQSQRELTLHQFRSGSNRILIAGDLIVRSIGVQNVDLVINYDFPSNLNKYFHRIKHSGRFGRMGVAINFITNEEKEAMKNIESFYNTHILEISLKVGDTL